MTARITEWRRLPVSLTELCIATTLRCGQSFRWKHNETDDSYACTLRGRIVQLKQDVKGLEYRSIWPATVGGSLSGKNGIAGTKRKSEAAHSGRKRAKKEFDNTRVAKLLTPPSSTTPSAHEADIVEDEAKDAHTRHNKNEAGNDVEDNDDTQSLIMHYLNLEPNLTDLYTQWSNSDANFKKKAPRFTGVRILRQDSWEALVCFICSSNNNIARIGQMVDKLCSEYGRYIGVINDSIEQDGQGRSFFDFPDPERLIGPQVESRLRELGFGYRAKYIAQTAQLVHERGGKAWLDSLRNSQAPSFGSSQNRPAKKEAMKPEGRDGYRTAHEALLELQGVGPKVADCVCLMGLAWGEAVPVDTHVWQIAQRDYKFGKGKHSSLTKATYDAVANHFRKLWGVEAGWAHSVLFTADLRVFAERLATTKVEIDTKTDIKDEYDGGKKAVVKTETKRIVSVKKEIDESTTEMRPRLEIDAVAISSSERVKRRRK